MRTGEENRRFEGHSGRLLGWHLTPQIALSWSDDNAVRRMGLDASQRRSQPILMPQASEGRERSRLSHPLASFPEGRQLANVVIGTSDGRLVHFQPGQRPARRAPAYAPYPRHRVHLPEAEAFATCSDDGTVRMWRNGEAVMGGVFYTSAPVVRLLPVKGFAAGPRRTGPRVRPERVLGRLPLAEPAGATAAWLAFARALAR